MSFNKFFHLFVPAYFVLLSLMGFHAGAGAKSIQVDRNEARSISSVCVSEISCITYYVAQNGSDSNDGSKERPLRSLSFAVRSLSPGDTLLVGPGVYDESLYGTIPSGTSWDAPIIIRAQSPSDRPVLMPSKGDRVLHFENQEFIIIDGLVLDGTHVVADVIKLTKPTTQHIRIQNSEIRNGPSQGILTTNGASKLEFINLDIHDNGTTDFDHGIYISSSSNLVDGCRIFRNSGWGVHVFTARGRRVNNVIIRNSIVFDNARFGKRGDGILLARGTANAAYNNVVYGNAIGIRIDYDAAMSVVAYNTVSLNRRSYGGIFVNRANGTVVRNNIVWSNKIDKIQDAGNGSVVRDNLVGIDPLFRNFAQRDFRLGNKSPAKSAGAHMLESELGRDISGNIRRKSESPDLGAYQDQ